jgi:predicted enzyme related to lactoylglutathione lyase
MDLMVNIDVPDLSAALAFYQGAFGLRVTRRFGSTGAELEGLPVRLYLLEKPAGTIGAAEHLRNYQRHWTPVHLDVVVDDIEAALARTLAVGAVIEDPLRDEVWGRVVGLSDPFGHGVCLVQFQNRGYDESPSGRERIPQMREMAYALC